MGIFCIPIFSLVKTVLRLCKNGCFNVHENVRLVNRKSIFDRFGFRRYPNILRSAASEEDTQSPGFFDRVQAVADIEFPIDIIEVFFYSFR